MLALNVVPRTYMSRDQTEFSRHDDTDLVVHLRSCMEVISHEAANPTILKNGENAKSAATPTT